MTSFRMYASVPGAAPAWRRLFDRVFADVALSIAVIDWTGPLAELWQSERLCCAFMCGWPFARTDARMQAIAAPVPSPPRYRGLPRYCSEFLVRARSGWRSLEDTFGHRIGWTVEDSQSGFNAPRAHLARFAASGRRALYRESLGPLRTPRAAIDALVDGVVDVVALDCYWLDLCRRHAAERLADVRCVATTPWTPIPLLVAASGVDAAVVERLRGHLLALHTQPAYRPLLADVLLAKFVAPEVAAYRALESMSRAAADAGYHVIQ